MCLMTNSSDRKVKIMERRSVEPFLMCDSDSRITNTKGVHFATVQVREYPIILGDNPCTSGPPITLDWIYEDAAVTSSLSFMGKRTMLHPSSITRRTSHTNLRTNRMALGCWLLGTTNPRGYSRHPEGTTTTKDEYGKDEFAR